MKSLFYKIGKGRIHALRFGHGEQLLLALHGFADRAQIFAGLEKSFFDRYTVVAIDLPFHGQTTWHKTSFLKKDLLRVIAKVLKSEGKTRCALMGFSFGARLAQGILPDLAHQLDHLYLLSPDGVKTKGMHTAAHTPMWLRKLLFRILQHPDWFISTINFGHRLHLIPAYIQQFVRKHLSRPKRIQRTLGCWLSMDSFYLRNRDIRAILRATALPTTVYIGADDPFLDQNTLEKMYGDLPNARLFVLEGKGHGVL